MPPPPPLAGDHALAELAAQLGALASAPRLALLYALRTPRRLHAIRIPAHDGGRPLSRQTVSHHRDHLERAGLLRHLGTEAEEERLTLDHAQLAAIIARLQEMFVE